MAAVSPSPSPSRATLALPLAEHDLAQRAAEVGVELGAGLVEVPRRTRAAAVQLAPHAGALRALAGEQEGQAAAAARPSTTPRPLSPSASRPRRSSSSVGATPSTTAAALQARAPRERQAGVRHAQLGRGAEEVAQPGGLPRRPPGPRPETGHGTTPPAMGARPMQGSAAGASSRIRCAFVPLIAEGGDAGAAGPAVGRPGHRLGQQRDVARAPVDVRRGLVDVQGARQQRRGAAPAPS